MGGEFVSAIVDRALASAGLAEVLAARLAGDFAFVKAATARLRAADLLVLGALADRVRAVEVGDVVRVYADPSVAPDVGSDVVAVAMQNEGLAFLREVAVARVTGPKASRVRIDWTACGLELAQVSLGFGANELVGRLSNKRGLPLADGAMATAAKKSQARPAQLVKRDELSGFIKRSGRRAVFVGAGGAAEEPIAMHASAGDEQ